MLKPSASRSPLAAAALMAAASGCFPLGGGCLGPHIDIRIESESEAPPLSIGADTKKAQPIPDVATQAQLEDWANKEAVACFTTEFNTRCADVLWSVERGSLPMLPLEAGEAPGHVFALRSGGITALGGWLPSCYYVLGEFQDGRHFNGFTLGAFCVPEELAAQNPNVTPFFLEHLSQRDLSLATDLDVGEALKHPLVCQTAEECLPNF